MRISIDSSDLPQSAILDILDHDRSVDPTLKHTFESGFRRGRVNLSRDQWDDFLDALEQYDQEHVDRDVGPVWNEIRKEVRSYPELHEELEKRWLDVY